MVTAPGLPRRRAGEVGWGVGEGCQGARPSRRPRPPGLPHRASARPLTRVPPSAPQPPQRRSRGRATRPRPSGPQPPLRQQLAPPPPPPPWPGRWALRHFRPPAPPPAAGTSPGGARGWQRRGRRSPAAATAMARALGPASLPPACAPPPPPGGGDVTRRRAPVAAPWTPVPRPRGPRRAGAALPAGPGVAGPRGGDGGRGERGRLPPAALGARVPGSPARLLRSPSPGFRGGGRKAAEESLPLPSSGPVNRAESRRAPGPLSTRGTCAALRLGSPYTLRPALPSRFGGDGSGRPDSTLSQS
ncbi:basic proline-rich protein-like [Cervus canadensis]|uniref:basic proline-rich protein-like n=1 Tax=Cervus canadensis TaxID=1574408 RepID=UPI001CA35DB8|nr:basic proline-rich protein-like [Cervus canadensis]